MKNKKETQNVSVEELLEKMTLDEKLQQLTQLSGVFFDTADKTAATGPKENVGLSTCGMDMWRREKKVCLPHMRCSIVVMHHISMKQSA